MVSNTESRELKKVQGFTVSSIALKLVSPFLLPPDMFKNRLFLKNSNPVAVWYFVIFQGFQINNCLFLLLFIALQAILHVYLPSLPL